MDCYRYLKELRSFFLISMYNFDRVYSVIFKRRNIVKALIQSFSFKRTGYPVDKTGKGGGFVFDCRAIDAYDYSLGYGPNTPFEHMHLTGLDPEISVALDKDEGTQAFYQAVCTLVLLDINKCIRRGFNVMTVNFGCTAGQHRSVYLAEKLARDIGLAFDELSVELVHLEKDHWPNK